MNVTFQTAVPCIACGYQLKAFRFCTVRVNKRSMRGTSHLRWAPGRCPECQADNPDLPSAAVWRITPDDQAKITAYRLKRWPELATEGLVA